MYIIRKYRQRVDHNRLSLPDKYGGYKGKQVTIVGMHVHKGWEGMVEDTLSNGTAWVRLNNNRQERILVKIDDLFMG